MPAAHLVSAYAGDVGAAVAQLRVDAKTNEHKAALELLGVLPLKGKVGARQPLIFLGGKLGDRGRRVKQHPGRSARCFANRSSSESAAART